LHQLRLAALGLLPLLGACSVHDGYVAHEAQKTLMGMSEPDLEACLGAPDQRGTFGNTDVLTYYATSSSSMSYSIPIVGGIGMSNGGYCHATFRVDNGRVTRVLYSGEKNTTAAADAYCAPIVRTCMAYLTAHPEAQVQTPPTQGTSTTAGTSSQGTVPSGATSATPQPGASQAAMPSTMPSPTPR